MTRKREIALNEQLKAFDAELEAVYDRISEARGTLGKDPSNRRALDTVSKLKAQAEALENQMQELEDRRFEVRALDAAERDAIVQKENAQRLAEIDATFAALASPEFYKPITDALATLQTACAQYADKSRNVRDLVRECYNVKQQSYTQILPKAPDLQPGVSESLDSLQARFRRSPYEQHDLLGGLFAFVGLKAIAYPIASGVALAHGSLSGMRAAPAASMDAVSEAIRDQTISNAKSLREALEQLP